MNPEITRKYQDIKDGVNDLGNQVSDITSLANDELRAYGEEAMDEVSTNVKRAVAATKENPWTTVVVVSLVALVVGLLFGQSRSNRR
jgi:ElaB/YqjD/DUF883 family membrane-anchored ribosome-binding protein